MIRSSGKRNQPKNVGFTQRMKSAGQEVRMTKNGHPYAVLRASVMKKPRPNRSK